MSRLAEGLKALGLKSGGGLKERAMRLYSVKGLKKEQYPKNIKAKVVKKKEEEGEEEKKDDKTSNKRKVGGGNKEIAFHEVLIHYLATNELEEVVVATKKHVEKRHTMLPGIYALYNMKFTYEPYYNMTLLYKIHRERDTL